ncbi:MAG: S8 family serine peptidase [Lautropia sp.]|nr:S8 family serine peptidase [Lautropia sp.]
MSPTRTHITRWSMPLLIALTAASCGGGGGDNPGTSDGSGSTGGSGPAPGTTTSNNTAGTFADPSSGASASLPAAGTPLNGNCSLNYTAPAFSLGSGGDPRLRNQWHLSNTGQYTGAVTGEDLHLGNTHAANGRGQGIRIAVVDDGLDVVHEDLLPNVIAGASYNYLGTSGDGPGARGSAWPLPCSRNDTHGTAVGGIIAGRDSNGKGISGIASRAGIVGYNALASKTNSDALDAIVRDAAHTHIYNNSWGATDDGHFHAPEPSLAAFDAALGNGLKNGRNGLGSIYVFAAGNGGMEGDYSAYDGNVTRFGTIATCAVNAAGKRANYSEPGPNLLVCAPSGEAPEGADPLPSITTTAPQNSYRSDFNGTSAATPMVSGAAALVLQANPSLSWRDLRLVLAKSARQIDPTDKNWSSFGGYNFSHLYGFGAVDVDKAVALARTWQSVGNSSTVKQCGPYQVNVGAPIPEGSLVDFDTGFLSTMYSTLDLKQPVTGGVRSTVAIPADCDIQHIEHVDVKVATGDANGTTSRPGELHITLTSPSNQTSTLALPHRCFGSSGARTNCTGLSEYTFGVTRHIEEPAATAASRNWTLNVLDRVADDHSALQSWSLTLYGR